VEQNNTNKLDAKKHFDTIIKTELANSLKATYNIFASLFGGVIVAFALYEGDVIKSIITGFIIYITFTTCIFFYRVKRRKFIEEFTAQKSENESLKRKIENLTLQNEFCSLSSAFPKEYNKLATYDILDKNQLNEKSDLWYLFVNTKQFNKCEKIITKYINEVNSKNNPDKYLENVEIWSLLGASELLVKFRTSVNNAQLVEEELFFLLKKPIPIIPITTQPEFIGATDSILESTHKNKKGLQLINCTYERVLLPSNGYDFTSGQLKYQGTFSRNLRSTKVFVKFHFEKNNNYNIHLIRDVLPSFKDTVESFAICQHSENMELKFIVIEAHFPCGKFHDLFELSKDLENCLTKELIKETYIAYSGGPILTSNSFRYEPPKS
jgi:hypothetical protein